MAQDLQVFLAFVMRFSNALMLHLKMLRLRPPFPAFSGAGAIRILVLWHQKTSSC
jgi:hypothetical protein